MTVFMNNLIDEKIKKWEKKRIDMLHWRRTGDISGGVEQSEIIVEALKDLEQLKTGIVNE